MSGFVIKGRSASIFLPYDLSENIFRCMQRDFTSLKNASLVCHSWSWASRTWLFRKLALDPRKYNALLALIDIHDSKTYSFLTHCRSIDIQSIDIRMMSPFFVKLFTALTELSIQRTSALSLKGLFEFVSRFPQVHSVSFKEVSWISTAPLPLSTLPSITHLEVCGPTMDFDHFFKMIARFQVFPSLTHLASISMREKHIPSFVAHVANESIMRGVQSLTLSLAHEDEAAASGCMPPNIPQKVSGLLRTQSQSMLHLKYRQTYGMDPCLIPLPNIRHFRVSRFIDVRFPAQNITLQWTPRMLASMTMPNVLRIELDLILNRAGELDQYNIHWAFMDFALTATDFANLKNVVFDILGPVDLMSAADILSRRMPLLTERGILYVRSGEDSWDQRVTQSYT